jgi:RNA polymerase sigma-54 factor
MMKPSLQVRLSQHLALTPQLQQSIRLLQLSTLEVHQEIGQMLEQNPFLEAEDDGGISYDTAPERASASDTARNDREAVAAEAPAGNDDGGSTSEGVAEIGAEEFGTPGRDDWENGTEGDDFDGIRETPSGSSSSSGDGGDDGQDASERRAGVGTLADHLRTQSLALRLSSEDRAALNVLIDSLNEDGWLDDTLQAIGERLAEMFQLDDPEELEVLNTRLEHALRWLQSLEPPGVGARNLSECIALQLRLKPRSPARTLAMRIAQDHLDLLARRDFKRLGALTGADEAQMREAQALIRACEPKPGRPFVDAESNIVVPDVIVKKTGRGLTVVLNPDVMPKLRINDLYAAVVRGQRGAGSTNFGSRLQEARWFVKNIQQRFDTILRVSRAIVDRQKGFFSHGAIAMKPLVLREIADELGLHESTISRVTTAKYMATPNGTYELKYFFGSSLNTEAGGNASSTAVRALIQQFVAAEDAAKPLSDSQLADMLEEQGIQVARRTVAKYREALKIAPASVRKAL